MNKKQLQITLLGAAAGYLFSEYLILRRTAKTIRRTLSDKNIEIAKITWAEHMVEHEAARGKYDDNLDAITADFDYYFLVAPDPRQPKQG